MRGSAGRKNLALMHIFCVVTCVSIARPPPPVLSKLGAIVYIQDVYYLFTPLTPNERVVCGHYRIRLGTWTAGHLDSWAPRLYATGTAYSIAYTHWGHIRTYSGRIPDYIPTCGVYCAYMYAPHGALWTYIHLLLYICMVCTSIERRFRR
jgi:glycine/D-amino acid oxidase-like deaminating enzyme